MDNTVQSNQDTNSEEYKMGNTPLFSLNEIMAYSSYVGMSETGTQIRDFDRAGFEQLAEEKYYKKKKDLQERIDSIPDGGFSGDY